MDKNLLERFRKILNEVDNALEELDPDHEAHLLMFSSLQELGYAVNKLLRGDEDQHG